VHPPSLAAASKRGQAPDFLDAESAAPSGDEFVAASMAAAPKRQREAKPLAPMSDEDRKLWDDFSSVKEYNPDFSRRLREAAALKQQTQHVRDGGLMDLGGDSEDDEEAAATAVREYLYATMAYTKAAPVRELRAGILPAGRCVATLKTNLEAPKWSTGPPRGSMRTHTMFSLEPCAPHRRTSRTPSIWP